MRYCSEGVMEPQTDHQHFDPHAAPLHAGSQEVTWSKLKIVSRVKFCVRYYVHVCFYERGHVEDSCVHVLPAKAPTSKLSDHALVLLHGLLQDLLSWVHLPAPLCAHGVGVMSVSGADGQAGEE